MVAMAALKYYPAMRKSFALAFLLACPALASYPTCVAGNPEKQKTARSKNDEGMNQYRAGKLAEATRLFEEAASLDCNYVLARLNLAATLSKMQPTPIDRAAAALEEAYALDPQKTLQKVRHDADYFNIRDHDHFRSTEVGTAYTALLKLKKARYINDIFGLSLEYPGDWTVETDSTTLSKYQSPELIASLGEPGTGEFAGFFHLLVKVFESGKYKRVPIIDHPTEKPIPDIAQRTFVSGMPSSKFYYRVNDIEATIIPVYRYEVPVRDKLFLFEVNCSGIDTQSIRAENGKTHDQIINEILRDCERDVDSIMKSVVFGSTSIHATGIVRNSKPWQPGMGPYFEIEFNPPLKNVYTDSANDEPRKEVKSWETCDGASSEIKKYVGKRVAFTAVPTAAYAETLCPQITKIEITN